MKTLKVSVMATAICAAMGFAVPASAGPSVTGAFVNGQQQWSDDSGEILIDVDGSGGISKGDYLVGIVGMTSFPTSGVGVNTVTQLTAAFATEVLSAPSALPALACGNAALTSCALFEFGAVALGFNHAWGLANAALGGLFTTTSFLAPSGGALDPATVALFIEDNQAVPTAFDRDGGTMVNAFNTGSDGTVRVGVKMAPGDAWAGTGPALLGQFFSVPSGTGVGSFSINATIYDQNFPGYIFAPLITANGTLKPTSGSQFVVTDDTTFEVNIRKLPEPGTLALLGFGLLGLAGGSLKRRKMS
ncbi:PEP-CTERM sorting domain-containing protein [Accumulibacter sp.]|uniref:PEP-CTERM sorting domain-containing protein n=1 Tax=Accumulibacter sp. TaxID=2053492 RepID=UPI0028C3F3C9|nr:PEP-CTERM sorting domain-containing protein [Accumulibacter sp.]